MAEYVAVQIGWGVLFSACGTGGPPVGWLRTTGREIHGIKFYMSREEAESEIVKDAAENPERIGHYEIHPSFEGFCGNPVPCARCREHLSEFRG
jgi:hypothetical protein